MRKIDIYQFFDTFKTKDCKIRGNCNLLITVKFHELEWSSPLASIFMVNPTIKGKKMSTIYMFKQLYIDPLAIANRYTQLSIVIFWEVQKIYDSSLSLLIMVELKEMALNFYVCHYVHPIIWYHFDLFYKYSFCHNYNFHHTLQMGRDLSSPSN